MASELQGTPSVEEFISSLKSDVEASKRSSSSSSRSSADSIIDLRLGLKPRSTYIEKLFKIELISTKDSHPFEMRTITVPPNTCVKVGRMIAKNKESQTNAYFDTKVLSRHHAIIWYSSEGNKFWLKDTKSSNGTYLNNVKLETEPAELRFGDIIKFGLDVVENHTKEKHGCIIAYVKLYLPDGAEAATITPTTGTSSHPGETIISYRDLHRLNTFLQESIKREEMLQNKLNTLQSVVKSTRDNTVQCWNSMVSEDQLLNIIQTLENKLMIAKQNMPENALKNEIFKLLDEKSSYQHAAKEALRRVYNERLDAKRMLTKLEVTQKSSEEESKVLTEQILSMQRSHEDANTRLFTLENEYTKTKEEKEALLRESKNRESAYLAPYVQKMKYIKKKCEIIRSQISVLGDGKDIELQNQLVQKINTIISDLNISKYISNAKDNKIGSTNETEKHINGPELDNIEKKAEENKENSEKMKDLTDKTLQKKSTTSSLYLTNLLKNVQENLKKLEIKIGNEYNDMVVPSSSTSNTETDEQCSKKLKDKEDYLLLKKTISMLEAAYNEVGKDKKPTKDLHNQLKSTSANNNGCGDYDTKTNIPTTANDEQISIFYKNKSEASTDSEDDESTKSVKRSITDNSIENSVSNLNVDKTAMSIGPDDDDGGNHLLTAKNTVTSIDYNDNNDYISLIKSMTFNSFNKTNMGGSTLSSENFNFFDIDNNPPPAKKSKTFTSDDDDFITALSLTSNDVELKSTTARKNLNFLAKRSLTLIRSDDDVDMSTTQSAISSIPYLDDIEDDRNSTTASVTTTLTSSGILTSEDVNVERKSSATKKKIKFFANDVSINPSLTFIDNSDNEEKETDILLSANKALDLLDNDNSIKDDNSPTTKMSVTSIKTITPHGLTDEELHYCNVSAYKNVIEELKQKIFCLENGTQQSLQFMQLECDLLKEKIEMLTKLNDKLKNEKDQLKKSLKKNKNILSKTKKRKEQNQVPTKNTGVNTDEIKNEKDIGINDKIGDEIVDEIKDESDDDINEKIDYEIDYENKNGIDEQIISAIFSDTDLSYSLIQLKKNIMQEADEEINNANATAVGLNVYDDYMNDIKRDNNELCLELDTLKKNALHSRANLVQTISISVVSIIIIAYIVYIYFFS